MWKKPGKATHIYVGGWKKGREKGGPLCWPVWPGGGKLTYSMGKETRKKGIDVFNRVKAESNGSKGQGLDGSSLKSKDKL